MRSTVHTFAARLEEDGSWITLYRSELPYTINASLSNLVMATLGSLILADDEGGSGLGIAIVRTIAVDQGGSVALSSRPEGGLRAELCPPLDLGPDAAP